MMMLMLLLQLPMLLLLLVGGGGGAGWCDAVLWHLQWALSLRRRGGEYGAACNSDERPRRLQPACIDPLFKSTAFAPQLEDALA